MSHSGISKPVAVLQTGDPIAPVEESRGSWTALIREAAGAAGERRWGVVDLRDGADLPPCDSLQGMVITGSASSVTERAPWMLRAEAYLRDALRRAVPTFGICFGHQMMAQAFGGRVERNPRGRQIGSVDLVIDRADLMFDGLGESLRVNTTHVDVVTALPPEAVALGRTPLDDHAVVRFGPRAWGVQFHPEIDADVMQQYVEARREIIVGEGFDADAITREVDAGLAGRETLRRFLEWLDALDVRGERRE